MTDLLAPGDVGIRTTRRPSVLVVASFVVIVLAVACGVFGPMLFGTAAAKQDLGSTLVGPSPHHLLGTDELGRDVLARIVVGSRTAIAGPVVIALGAMIIGTGLGLVSGYNARFVDTLIMRWVDLMYAVPQLLVAIVVVGVLNGTYWAAVVVLVIITAPGDTRLIRGATLEQRQLPYVQAMYVSGVPAHRVLFYHIWPTLMPITIAQSFLNFATSIVTLSSLSFLGFGVPPGSPDWGRMLSDGRSAIVLNPFVAIAPGLAIALTAAAMNILGDWFYDKLKQRGE